MFAEKYFKIEFDSKLAYNEKYLKIKVKSYEDKIQTNFYENGMPNKGSHKICLWVILIDSVDEIGKSYHPQLLAEECKYIIKEKRINKYINSDRNVF